MLCTFTLRDKNQISQPSFLCSAILNTISHMYVYFSVKRNGIFNTIRLFGSMLGILVLEFFLQIRRNACDICVDPKVCPSFNFC